ncbi:DUF1648 domain-containing protein [Streptomyces montanisoli]|uniref:DUF1648 domain-containing protein n=1 Tax=Streptomyces montanisoli TaxID=2798581 RepID=A0A940MIR1_9ACTN|nr:DUF1648 domain-containing protein [Streptomyces montanisoli]MBP0461578.1 DUF1648 domain-containing protein [Streptomyces montanisoli]
MVFAPGLRLWLLPSGALLIALAVWGAVRYPHLPDRIPRHIGAGGVDAWAGRSIAGAFALVFVYAGVTALLFGCAEWVLRAAPRTRAPAARAGAWSSASSSYPSSTHRPRSRESARRVARSLLVLDACVGVSFFAGCAVLWRSAPDPHVPVWIAPAVIVPIVAGTACTVVAALRERAAERRPADVNRGPRGPRP